MSECESCQGHGEVDCPNCDASGVDDESGYDSCEECTGGGSVECSECGGTGVEQ